MEKSSTAILEEVKEYYGTTVKKTDDLQTGACLLNPGSIPVHVRDAIKHVHHEVASKYYGCGLVAPEHLENASVLDLGSGAGYDCFILSKLVGENGRIVGIDMTDEQVETARKYEAYHAEAFGYKAANTKFVTGYIEKLGEAGLKDNTFDIIVSNCVVNLSPDKKAVLKEAYRVLKEGGEFYFSDIYANKVVPLDIRNHKVLWGECISGALWWKDLASLATEVGFAAPRLVTVKSVPVCNPELAKVVEGFKFVSATYRLFKLPTCNVGKPTEATYKGGITGVGESFKFDCKYTFPKDVEVPISNDVAKILNTSRFKDQFIFSSTACCGSGCCDEPFVDPFGMVTTSGHDSSKHGCSC